MNQLSEYTVTMALDEAATAIIHVSARSWDDAARTADRWDVPRKIGYRATRVTRIERP